MLHKLGKAFSTIATILKEEEIKWIDVAFIASKMKWPEILNEVEKLLLLWINEKQLTGDSVSKMTICE